MTLRDLLREIPAPHSADVSDASVGDTNVTAVTYDSRQAGPGAVFVALRGVNADGASFAREALSRGIRQFSGGANTHEVAANGV